MFVSSLLLPWLLMPASDSKSRSLRFVPPAMVDAIDSAGDTAPPRSSIVRDVCRAVDVREVPCRTPVRLAVPERTLEPIVDRLSSRSERCRR